MQTDAAGSLPLSATVAMYVQQMQPGVEAEELGKVVAMELKSLHQVCITEQLAGFVRSSCYNAPARHSSTRTALANVAESCT